MAGITTRQRALAAAFLAIGIAVRLRLFFAARSLWLDEAMLALNLLRRSSLGLFRPLDFEQSAPPLFLWLERAAVTIGGSSEMVLRTVPMLAGIATLLILAVLAARLLPPAAALFAIGLAALSPLLIHFGNEFKQYSLDGLAAAGLLLSTHRVLVSPDERRRWLALVEDTVTTGGSTLQALDIVEAAGGKVARVLCLVDRGEGGGDAFAARGVALEALFTRADLPV
jgi:predicted membrane-bound mannosyltransferase